MSNFSLRLFVILIALQLCASRVSAQSNPIPNPSFEVWTTIPVIGSSPNGWIGMATQSSDAHSGQSAATGEVTAQNPSPGIVTGTIDFGTFQANPGFPINYRPGAFEGWYKLTSTQHDVFAAMVRIKSAGQDIGIAFFVDSTDKSDYTYFGVPIVYFAEGVPDTAEVDLLLINSQTTNPNIGSSFTIDDVALTGTAGVSLDGASTTTLLQAYPNPARGHTTLSYSLAEPEHVRIDVINTLGERVASVLDAPLAAGLGSVSLDVTKLQAGSYLCQLWTGKGLRGSCMLRVVR